MNLQLLHTMMMIMMNDDDYCDNKVPRCKKGTITLTQSPDAKSGTIAVTRSSDAKRYFCSNVVPPIQKGSLFQ